MDFDFSAPSSINNQVRNLVEILVGVGWGGGWGGGGGLRQANLIVVPLMKGRPSKWPYAC